jgi:3-hydroxyisobutyrate dehydrogenase-like beta-hydroxyacid dehydrogenase
VTWEEIMKVGFIGLGAMGRGMATRLVDGRHEVHVWNRSPKPSEEMVQRGAHREESTAGAFTGDAVITMLANNNAVRAAIVSRDVLRTAPKDLVHIVMSTLSVAFARELEQAHAETGIAYIAAPVMGRPDVAAAGKLNILAAGDPTVSTE